MPYKHVLERQDYTDLSSGRVLYNQPGAPAFPVRLASEVLQRCLIFREANGNDRPCHIFDPCCGGAYHLTALAFLHWDAIAEITASDFESRSAQVARKNLDLLTLAGLDRRITELSVLLDHYGKESHAGALASAARLRAALDVYLHDHSIRTSVSTANALTPEIHLGPLAGREIDVIFTDLPYGLHSAWQGLPDRSEFLTPVGCLLENLLAAVRPHSILAICADKAQKITHDAYRRIDHFQVGKRQVVLLKKR